MKEILKAIQIYQMILQKVMNKKKNINNLSSNKRRKELKMKFFEAKYFHKYRNL